MGQTRRLRRLGRHRCRGQRVRWRTATSADHPRRGRPAAQAVRRRRPVSLDGRYGIQAVRRRAVSIFPCPYPEPIERLKQALYPKLLPIARNWWAKLGREAPWPDSLDDWLASCHAAGQTRSTALMLKYGTNDWNALHQDLYGELVFPLQVVINLSDPETDYTGGEFLLVEQRPRAQSRGTAMQLPQGHGYVLTTRDRPVRTSRGWSASPVRHGLSTIRSGERYAMGLIFHDAA
ncbi:hypothetical protein C1D13_11290 [Mycobacterium tuberculosis variant bovis]|nr:hypothetical protein C1D13_11290 [Mycobacterium tuberculosis variant bovis]